MARNLGLDDVVDHFTLVGDELDLLRNKSGATRLGFAVLLKFVLWRGRFPRAAHEAPDDGVAHLARQVRVPAAKLASFDFDGRTAKRHRSEIRAYTGFRECSLTDAQTLASWLVEHVADVERREDRVREQLLARCRAELIEPPTPDRVTEIARSALHQAEQALLAMIAARIDRAAVTRLEALIAVSGDDDREDENVLALIKTAPGNVSLDTMLTEISKLEAIRAVGLPADLFAGVAPNVVAGWRARSMVESPSHLREHPQATKLVLLCALLVMREREVTDTLAQLLISTIQRINAHAEQKVVAEFVKDFRRVRGKDTMLRKIAEASLRTPDDSVREVIYPISAVAAGNHGHSEADLRYTARRYFTIDGARLAAVQLADATFAARDPAIWGHSTTTVASDSTHFRAYDQNLFTEWHSRYGGRGVLIYWHVEKNRWSCTPS